jgi:hypothetical protein
VYAGPKDLGTLARISEKFGLGDSSGNLEDIVSYGWLSFISPVLKPIAQFMLKSLLFINGFTHNYGWAIVIPHDSAQHVLLPPEVAKLGCNAEDGGNAA